MERRSKGLLQGKEDRGCDERKKGVEEKRKAHLYAGYCALLV